MVREGVQQLSACALITQALCARSRPPGRLPFNALGDLKFKALGSVWATRERQLTPWGVIGELCWTEQLILKVRAKEHPLSEGPQLDRLNRGRLTLLFTHDATSA